MNEKYPTPYKLSSCLQIISPLYKLFPSLPVIFPFYKLFPLSMSYPLFLQITSPLSTSYPLFLQIISPFFKLSPFSTLI